MAIRRNKLDRKVDLNIQTGRVIDMPPGWKFTIKCKFYGEITFDLNCYRENGRENLAGHFRDAIWSMRHELVGNSLKVLELTGIRTFWKFLDYLYTDGESISQLDQIDRKLLDSYRAWLELQVVSRGKNKGRTWSIASKKNRFKNLKTLLVNRQKCVPDKVSFALSFPFNPFPNSNLLTSKRKAYSISEQERIDDALHADLLCIRSEGTPLKPLQVLAVHLLVLAKTTGRNQQSLLDLRRDSLTESPLPGREILITTKRRGWSTHAISLRQVDEEPKDVTTYRAIPADIGGHIRFLIEYTEPLIDEAAPEDREYVFLWRVPRGERKGRVVRLVKDNVISAVCLFVLRHDLRDDLNKALALNMSRLRATFGMNIYNGSGGDLRKVMQALGHKRMQTTIDHYTAVPPDGEGKHVQALDEMERHFARTEIDGKVLIAADGKIPMDLKELLSGGYNNSIVRCKNPFRENGKVCEKFLACFRCHKMMVFQDDLWRLFSFYYKLLSEKDKIKMKVQWEQLYAPIIRRIDVDIAPLFPTDVVVAARLKAQKTPHPAWKGHSCL